MGGLHTETNVFGSKLLATIGVKILGKDLTEDQVQPFSSIEELIDFKAGMRRPPKNNVPIDIIRRSEDCITVSGRLIKGSSLSHDPNIGALSIIAAALRKLGWAGKIVLTRHGLEQKHLGPKNKMIRIANIHHIDFHDESYPGVYEQLLKRPVSEEIAEYWGFDTTGEKNVSIFLHLLLENFTKAFPVFHNHAGCEKSYFYDCFESTMTPIAKYRDKKAYKAGDKDQIIQIPDLILADQQSKAIINIEAKRYQNRSKGIQEMAFFDAIEDLYIKPSYKGFSIMRTVVVFADTEETITEPEISFLLNRKGEMVLGANAPQIFKEALDTLYGYWA